MPYKPKQYCRFPGCNQLVDTRYCEQHKKPVSKYEEDRESASNRGYDRKWQRLRAYKLRLNPLCEECLKHGIVEPAEEVHHIKSVEQYPELRLVLDNLESLSKSCHSKKTAEENKKNV